MGRETGKKSKSGIARRLGRAAMFGAVRGLSSAAGAGFLGWITWWVQK
jgi:hypothetical protein